MPRVEIGETVQDTAGNALSGASCQVNKRETGAATVYLAETGATTVANPIISDASGRIEGWVEGGSYDLVVTPLTGTAYTQRFEAASGRNAVTTSAFPTTPADGEDLYYTADATNGVIWHFKYRAASASSFKWEFIGGQDLVAEVLTDESTASAAYAALATAGPSITVPLQGDYDVSIGAGHYQLTNAAFTNMSYDIGGTGAVDADCIQVDFTATMLGAVTASSTFPRRKAGLAAGTALVAKYKASAATGHWQKRWMRVRPVRVTG